MVDNRVFEDFAMKQISGIDPHTRDSTMKQMASIGPKVYTVKQNDPFNKWPFCIYYADKFAAWGNLFTDAVESLLYRLYNKLYVVAHTLDMNGIYVRYKNDTTHLITVVVEFNENKTINYTKTLQQILCLMDPQLASTNDKSFDPTTLAKELQEYYPDRIIKVISQDKNTFYITIDDKTLEIEYLGLSIPAFINGVINEFNQVLDTTITNEKGVKQSSLALDFTLLDPYAITELLKVLTYGCKKYGRNNWHKIDKLDSINHALAHIMDWLAGKDEEHALPHALCRLMFALSDRTEDDRVKKSI